MINIFIRVFFKLEGLTMKLPLMPKATAIWLIDNTSLSFTQISEFCGLHDLEVHGIADGEVAVGMRGYDPIDNKQLTREEIQRCENDESAKLELISSETIDSLPPRKKDTKYTPLSLRQEKPYAILWLIKRYPSELGISLKEVTMMNSSYYIENRDRLNPMEEYLYKKATVSPLYEGLYGIWNDTSQSYNHKL